VDPSLGQPHGAPKAAIAGAAGLPLSESFGQTRPSLIDRQTGAGAIVDHDAVMAGDKAVVTYSIPGGCLGRRRRRRSTAVFCRGALVVKKNGTNTTEFIYGNFEDWNTAVQDRGSVRPDDRRAPESAPLVRDVRRR